ncbi:GGDEF domain-containing protein [Motiliproteus sp. SC1-56]|uniref:GGDEF domain-containing protein n=1 Tax=Motiliproteus sp. SC1-56 TaxID=2799565 RepID=UPI001A8D60A3|nr:diguanylate cyclase [Motiliproteus sp. SC1-56]
MPMLKDTDNPRSFIRLLHLVAVAASMIILSLSSVAIYKLYENYVVASAEEQAIAVGQSIVALEQALLLNQTGDSDERQLVLEAHEIDRLDQSLKRFLAPYGILKIKVFSPAGRVVYSTDAGIIGEFSSDNTRLAEALKGNSNSKLETREQVFDLMHEQRFDVDLVETYVPIRNDVGSVVGSFEIYQDTSHHRRALMTSVLVSVVVFAAILALVFSLAYVILSMAVRQLARTQEELRKLAAVDSLTGLPNRREIMRSGASEFARYLRQRETGEPAPFSLIMADIDEFKALNDRLGHLAGDEALRGTAERIAGQVRRYSQVGRYGGEEFLVVLPEADADEARRVAERIREAVRGRPLTLAGQPVTVTLSLGVATVGAEEESFECVLGRADDALYQAKRQGRDRVEAGR